MTIRGTDKNGGEKNRDNSTLGSEIITLETSLFSGKMNKDVEL